MKVYAQTMLTPRMKVYDTNGPAATVNEDTGVMRQIRALMRPVMSVEDDNGNILYQSGQYYDPIVAYIVLALMATAVGFGAAKIIRGFIK